ncbi:MAG TPA: ABC transporter permease, partial [Nitrospiria bacterium]|nr:ABC transporter permease [Nitrospiria bacterium]
MKPKQRVEGLSYWQMVWFHLRQNRLAMFGGLAVIAFLILIALSADFLANEKPYALKMNGKTYYPILQDYLVRAGLAQWPEELVNADYKKLEYESGIFPPVRYLPNRVDLTNPFAAPSRDHLLGTDRLGRDILSGIIHGTRISITIGLVAMGIATFIGVSIGAVAGYFGGWVDLLINRLFELMLSIPTFFLLLSVAVFVEEPSVFYIMG